MQSPNSQLDRDIINLCQTNQYLEAVKLYKEKTGAGLKESKDYVDSLTASRGIPKPKGCFGVLVALVVCLFLFAAKEKNTEKFQCLPCGQPCDEVVYDHGGECAKCKMALVKSSTITHKNMEPAAICEYIKSHPKTILLDVRSKEEFEGNADPNFGTLKNAINIPIQELEKRIAELNAYKDREIIVFCSHSHRSPRASYTLTQNGFKNVINMSGGMSTLTEGDCKK